MEHERVTAARHGSRSLSKLARTPRSSQSQRSESIRVNSRSDKVAKSHAEEANDGKAIKQKAHDEFAAVFVEAEDKVLNQKVVETRESYDDVAIDRIKYKHVFERVEQYLKEAVQTINDAEYNSRQKLRMAVIALSKALKMIMEMVEVIEMGDRSRLEEKPVAKGRSLKQKMNTLRDNITLKMVSINILRAVIITFEFTFPMFSTAWLIFRVSGFYIAEQLDDLADTLETRRSCCMIV